ncbi:hypothetical protein O3P69_015426 [Scylla paramamosain]|uniref:AAA+ ATPase domain-containing protein n=1 Tax=Scylla paramamosain TaxID=85552 RepID=A0AAW0T4R1_SCYPA
MRRLYILVSKALCFKEPVLLVGETGCGKTTVCQMIAAQNNQDLYTVNCHMHSEGADFLGGLRPVRSHSDEDDRLFEWMDGPLILSMRDGSMFLADEVSLADDSVLERLNSVLEPERMLVLAEKGADIEGSASSSPDIIFAHENFRLIGTMNPGGDYGKKELSPALRNRFTEIWCPKVEVNRVSCDVLKIIEHNIRKDIVLNQEGKTELGKAMLQFLEHFTDTELGKKCILSIRDILSWVDFINKVTLQPTSLDPGLAYIHGACLVLLDGLGSGLTGSGVAGWKQLRKAGLNYLCQQVWQNSGTKPNKATLVEEFVCELNFVNTDTLFGIVPFIITKGSEEEPESEIFTFKAPRTCINLLRLLRGLQLSRPLLLEGSPGVGKTSLVIALAKASSHKIVRINLSEQTDVSDLFGADLPVEGGKGGKFAWRDGPLLQALREGSWVVLDELNLASQSVLEGLNACFDHRGEIFVPELGKTFHVEHQTTKIFACQNPQHQGGARKGLPKSFLNRFTQVHVEALSPADLEFILSMMYGKLPQDIVTKMVQFNEVITSEIQVQGLWDQLGGPWDLNLRDMFRWCEIILKNQSPDYYNPGEYVSLIYADRMRTKEDKKSVLHLYDRIFGEGYPSYQSIGRYNITAREIQIGHAVINRNFDGDKSEEDNTGDLYLMKNQLPVMESLVHCINMNWMALLVGESGTGKTCLVKLLARLTGQRLLTLTVNSDMDVTELLGGFQQMDYKQLLGEAVSTALSEIQATVRAALLLGEESRAVTVLAAWEELLAAQKDKAVRTMFEETTHFHYQCDLLLAVLQTITDTQVDMKGRKKRKKECVKDNGSKSKGLGRAAALRDYVKQLQKKVREAGTLSGGGTFHWVDSLLVKAIRDGDWILIDGVNICSASVLDRLNGLLEPGGELSLNEQGVVGGSVPTVAPHPQFRLFLAMNPLHGEISRAMRNRGLEICILESWTASEDLRALMLHAGLTSVPLQNTLFQAHQTVTERLPGYEQPGITQMKLAGSVTHQLIQAGYHSDLALKKALTLVYVRSHGSYFSGKRSKTCVHLDLGITPFALSLTMFRTLLDLLNVTLAQHHLDESSIELASQLLGQAVSQWRQQEEEKARHAEEEENLYCHKARTLAILPIEKEVKGYVKIARWNDINYFAVRESVDKSRRTLHRHMRNWEKNLRRPFAPLMCDTNSELNEDHTGAWDQKSEICPSKIPYPVLPPSPVMVKHSEDVGEYQVLSRLTFLTKRCHKLACRMLSEFSYTVYVDEVEDTTVKIISSYQELQAAATRAENAPSDKIRVKQLRGVMQRRRESLTRLFKVLDCMGVTYTRGNSLWDHKDIDSCLNLSPVDLEVAHTDVPSLLPAREAWPGCVKYLNRSIGRLSLLLSSLQQPHQDLGPELIKRLRGISCHLFSSELQDEEGGEGATNFEDSGGTGLGEGEGKKDVSDRIELEDQLESALKEGEKEEAGDKDLQEEDKGIEMNEDFEGKLQDVEKNERGESDSDNDDDNQKDLDKQMGETEKGADKLDEKIWGDNEESEDEEETKDQDEEDGPGEGEATESKMVAKDDNKSKKERDKEQKKKEDLDEIEDTRKENEMNEDGQEYDDNFTDPYGGEANIEDEEEEKMELPDDMNLDNEDEKEPKEDGEEEDAEENTAKGQEEPNEKESVEDDDGELGEKDDGEQDEEESSEERNKDERRQGTEEGNDLNNEENNLEDKAEASEDKSSKDPAEAAEMDTTDGSKDQTKEQSKSDTGGQQQTEDQEGTGQSESRTREDAHQGESSALVTQASANDQSDMKKPRRPGETDENRTLGDNNKRIQQGLMTKESKQRKSEADQQQQEKVCCVIFHSY